MEKQYFVVGGEYTGMDFETVVEGTAERHGPFTDYAEARRKWEARARATIDSCLHRFVIVEETAAGGAGEVRAAA